MISVGAGKILANNEGNGMTDFKKYFSLRNLCYHFSQRQFGHKIRHLSGLNLGREVPQTIFYCDGKGCRIISVYEY
jgi:hypothetical protein